MHRKTLEALEAATAARRDAEQVERDAIIAALTDAEHGDQALTSKITGYSREWLRKIDKVYYRSVTRYHDGRALITMPSDNVHPNATYEIRDTDKTTVLARVRGQELSDARAHQLADYRASGKDRNNIRLVDVSHLIP